MDQHPVPQHIASFEFKLFGNLTVRQFVTLAIPMSIAAALFFSSLPKLISYPLAFFFGLLGFIAAVVPIQGRPLDKWLVYFIRSIMSPTQRVWVKETRLPEFLNVVVSPTLAEEVNPLVATNQGRKKLAQYLQSMPKGKLSPIDVREEIALQRLDLELPQNPPITKSEAQLPPPIIWPTQTPQAAKPAFQESSLPQITPIQTTPAILQYPQESPEDSLAFPQGFNPPKPIPKISPHVKAYALPGLEQKLKSPTHREHVELISKIPRTKLASEMNFSIENIIPIHTPDKQIRLLLQVGKTRVRKLHFAPPEGFDLANLPIRGERKFEISEALKKKFHFEESQPAISPGLYDTTPNHIQEPHSVPKPRLQKYAPSAYPQKTKPLPKKPHSVPKPSKNLQNPKDVTFKNQKPDIIDSKISAQGQTSKGTPVSSTTLAKAKMAPLTDKPNIVSGLVLNTHNSPIEGAICVVKDVSDIPVRAVKTNKLGQFFSATPLPNGKYTIEVETEIADFSPLTINLEGKILEPLEITAQTYSDAHQST